MLYVEQRITFVSHHGCTVLLDKTLPPFYAGISLLVQTYVLLILP
jgi:hypothetical protein